jgi:hypothetical protein
MSVSSAECALQNEHTLALSDGTLLSKQDYRCGGTRADPSRQRIRSDHHDIWSLHTLPRSIAIVVSG